MSAPLSPSSWNLLAQWGSSPAPGDGVTPEVAPSPPPRRWLLVLRDGELAHRVLLLGPTARLGREADCDIQVDDARVDPIHLEIAPHDGGATFHAVGPGGFVWQGEACRAADVVWGAPVFLGDFLMITVEPWEGPA
jgi:hypothetical protein